MLFLQKTWVFIKKFWYVPLLLIGVIFTAIFLRKNTSVVEMLYKTIDSYKQQIAELDKLNKEQQAQKEELQKKYNLILQQVDEQHRKDEVVLTEERKKYIKQLIEQYKDDDAGMAKVFSQEFGIELK